MSFALKLSPQWLKNIFGSVGISKDPIEDLCYDLADATRGSLGFVRAEVAAGLRVSGGSVGIDEHLTSES